MDIAAVVRLLEQYLEELTHLRHLQYDNDQEFKLWCDKVGDVLKATFGEQSNEYAKFHKARPVSQRGSPEMNQRLYLMSVELRETALKSILQRHAVLSELQGQTGTVSEAVYPAGSQYDAYKVIKGLVGDATNQLTIADPYVDGSVVELLENCQHTTDIRILTRNIQGDFKLAATRFKQQQGHLEVRQDPGDLHDRFLVVDDEVYHLGASIKDAGNKVFGINKLGQPEVIQTTIQIIEDIWNKSINMV